MTYLYPLKMKPILMWSAAACLMLGAYAQASFAQQVTDEAPPADAAQEKPSKPARSSMSLVSVLQHAYQTNPTLIAARSELKATHELLPQAQAGWKPTVASTASITSTEVDGSNFGGGDGSTSKDLGLSLDQPLYRGGRTMAESAAARYTIQAQDAALRTTEQSVLLAAVTAYMDVLRDQSLLDLSLNNRDVLAKQLEAVQARFDVGEITITDVSQAKARLARADSDAITARGDLNISYAVFEEIIGMPPTILKHPQLTVELPASLDEAALIAEQTNPRVLTALYVHQASEKDVDNVFGELLPEVGVFGSWSKAYDPSPGLIEEQTNKAIGISATIPLYQAGAVRSRVRQAKHNANKRYVEIIDVKRSVRQEVVSAWSVWQARQSEIRSREAQIEASKIAREGVNEEATLGARTVLDTLDADQELLDAQSALVTARRNEMVARGTLLSSLGLLSPEALGFAQVRHDYAENLNDVTNRVFDMHVDRLQEVR